VFDEYDLEGCYARPTKCEQSKKAHSAGS
jgi:hypothetical protein